MRNVFSFSLGLVFCWVFGGGLGGFLLLFLGVGQERNITSGNIQVYSSNLVATGDKNLKVCHDVFLTLSTGSTEYLSLLYKLCLLLNHNTSCVCMQGNLSSFFKQRLQLKLNLITTCIKTHKVVPSEGRHPLVFKEKQHQIQKHKLDNCKDDKAF